MSKPDSITLKPDTTPPCNEDSQAVIRLLLVVGQTRPQSWNRYAYVLNNPIRLIDPNGLEEVDPVQAEEEEQQKQQQEQKKETQGRPTTTIDQAMFVGQFPKGGGATTIFRTAINNITKNANDNTVSVKLGSTQRVR